MRIAILGLLMIAASASATDGGIDVKSKPFDEQAKTIRVELASSDKYREITREDRALVTSTLDRMGTRIEEAGGVDRLAPQAMVDVFNDQEKVNAVLTRAREDSRMVCKRERKTGSNFTSNSCMTVAQRRRHSEASRDYLRRQSPSVDNNFIR